MLHKFKSLYRHCHLLINRAAFHLLFRRMPGPGEYSNSKLISVLRYPDPALPERDYLAFIRSNGAHRVTDDGINRIFDIALNVYASPPDGIQSVYDYLIAGGLNKYKAAYQFIDDALLDKYKGFIFLDDDLEISFSDLNDFLSYCTTNDFLLAQPSLTRDSYYSHGHLRHVPGSGSRRVDMIEVMCPYFSREALKTTIRTFDLSYSTWGLDYIWPKLLRATPVVVDAFTIKHTRPVCNDGAFYKYMTKIGISPDRELRKLKNIPLSKL